MGSETYTLRGSTLLGETDQAIKISLAEEEYWIPLSQVNSRTLHPDGSFEINMSAWIAKKKGFI